MVNVITFGLPRMHVEQGERRDFLPKLVAGLEKRGVKVHLEYGYGAGMGLSEEDYLSVSPRVRFVSYQEVFEQQYVLVLRCPVDEDLKMLEPGSCLISMLHYPTRPQRVELLRLLEVEAISLDSIKDDSGRRMIENLRSVAWNGLEAGFQVLRRTYPSPGMEDRTRAPVNATVLGVGAVGVLAVQAASRYGDVKLWKKLAEGGTPGVQVTAIDYDLAGREDVMHDILARTDILVDATQRRDASKPVVPNEWIAWLPEHAVIVDLSVDPYTLDADPPVVRGVEGIPQGNLDQYVFAVDDPKWDKLVPESIPSKHRRTTVTCYSWPGVHPKACMQHYGRQLEPLLYPLVEKGYDGISIEGDTYERALYRATLKAWLQDEADKSGREQKGSE